MSEFTDYPNGYPGMRASSADADAPSPLFRDLEHKPPPTDETVSPTFDEFATVAHASSTFPVEQFEALAPPQEAPAPSPEVRNRGPREEPTAPTDPVDEVRRKEPPPEESAPAVPEDTMPVPEAVTRPTPLPPRPDTQENPVLVVGLAALIFTMLAFFIFLFTVRVWF